MFDAETRAAIERVAKAHGWEAASLLAISEVESAGKAFALVDGKQEPLIRFEGHYFDKRLTEAQRKKARAAGLSSPTAGAVANPNAQAARWKLLARAAEINATAAFESCSYGVGQVMGAHWKWLGFKSVTELVNLCRKDVAGQVEVMARFIDKAGLATALKAKNWASFARGYNGPGYKKNAYDTKMARAYARYAKPALKPKPAADLTVKQVSSVMHRGSKGEFVKTLQINLNKLGYGPIEVDGDFGKTTDKSVRAFQKAMHLENIDGWAGPNTLEAMGKELAKLKLKPKLAEAEVKVEAAEAKVEASEKIVDDAAAKGKRFSVTEWLAGAIGTGGVVTTAKEVTNAVTETSKSFGELVMTVGPWILLAVVIAGGAGYIIYERRNKRIAAVAAQKVMAA